MPIPSLLIPQAHSRSRICFKVLCKLLCTCPDPSSSSLPSVMLSVFFTILFKENAKNEEMVWNWRMTLRRWVTWNAEVWGLLSTFGPWGASSVFVPALRPAWQVGEGHWDPWCSSLFALCISALLLPSLQLPCCFPFSHWGWLWPRCLLSSFVPVCPWAEAESPFVRALLWGLRKWLGALLWPFLGAGLLLCHCCPSGQAQMRRIFLKIFSHGKSLYENSYHSCFFLCKCGCIFHSWEMSENCSRGTKFQQGPWRPSWDQYCLYFAACRVQMMKSQSGTNKSCQSSMGETASCFWTPEALGLEPIPESGKRWNESYVLCPPLCGLYGVLLPTQDLGAQGKGREDFSMCCQRLSGASHPVPVGNGSWEPPGILFQW